MSHHNNIAIAIIFSNGMCIYTDYDVFFDKSKNECERHRLINSPECTPTIKSFLKSFERYVHQLYICIAINLIYRS